MLGTMSRSTTALLVLVAALACACQGREPAAPGATPDPDVAAQPETRVQPPDLRPHLAARIGALRKEAGRGAMVTFPQLDQAAADHAAYLAAGHGGDDLHAEVQGTPGFTGRTPAERAARAGYTEVVMGELTAFRGDASVVALWLEAPWARVMLLQPHARYLGFASQRGDGGPADVLLVGWRASDEVPSGGVVVWPPDGADDVATSWSGANLTPAVPEPTTGWPAGPVLSAVLAPAAGIVVTSHHLRDAAGAEVPHILLDPSSPLGPWLGPSTALYAEAPLAGGASYSVALGGTRAGEPWETSWRFRTASP